MKWWRILDLATLVLPGWWGSRRPKSLLPWNSLSVATRYSWLPRNQANWKSSFCLYVWSGMLWETKWVLGNFFFFFSLSFCYLLWFPENQSWKSFSFFSFAVWLIDMGSCRNRNGYWKKKKKKSSFCFFSAFSRQPNRDRLKNSFLVYLFVSLFAGKLRGKNGYRKKKKTGSFISFSTFSREPNGKWNGTFSGSGYFYFFWLPMNE